MPKNHIFQFVSFGCGYVCYIDQYATYKASFRCRDQPSLMSIMTLEDLIEQADEKGVKVFYLEKEIFFDSSAN